MKRSSSIFLVLTLALAAEPSFAQRTRSGKVTVSRTGKGNNLSAAQQKRRATLTGGDVRERATAIRLRANKMAKVARAAKTNSHAKRYMEKSFKKDMAFILGAITRLQRAQKLSPAHEHRAIGAVGRVLFASLQTRPDLVKESHSDAYAAIESRVKYQRKAPRHESSVEIETVRTHQILQSLTTKDGTIAPILKESGRQAPEFLIKKAGSRKVTSIKWDSLKPTEKLTLLQHASKGRSFFQDRGIPGMVFRRTIDKPTGQEVTLGGKLSAKNDNKLSVDGVLMTKVEFMGPNQVDNVGGVEFHVRQPGRASRNARDAFTLVDVFGSKTKSGHEHIPHEIPRGIMKNNAIERASLVDFYRRANVAAELGIVRNGYLLKPVKQGSVTYFDYLKSNGLAQLNQHFYSVATTGRSSMRESQLKMGAVGFRTGELYGKKSMYGFEARMLMKGDKDRGKFLDALQKGILTGHYGIRPSTMKSWHAQNVGKQSPDPGYVRKQSGALANLHYNRPIGTLLAEAPKTLQSHLGPEARNQLTQHAEINYGLKMLVHNWSKDPALMGQRSVQETVLAAQKAGLKALASGATPTQVVKTFARSSGLYEAFSRSLGMKDRAVQ